MSPTDQQLEQILKQLLTRRGPDKSICPSEVARLVAAGDWRPLMPRVRDLAKRLANDGYLNATQGDQIVDAVEARGPIRLRLKKK